MIQWKSDLVPQGVECRVSPDGLSAMHQRACPVWPWPTSRDLRSGLGVLAALAACIVWIVDGNAAPALPGEPCKQDAPPTARSDTERWVWNQVCIGEIADLNKHFDPDGPPLDPRSPDGWTDQRKLSTAFLGTILLHDPWHSAIPRHGVQIEGAWFDEEVDLVGAEIGHILLLDRSRFTADVHMPHSRIKSILSLDGSVVTGMLDLTGAIIGGHLFTREGAELGDLVLRGSKIAGQLGLSGAKIVGKLDLGSANIGGSLFMDAEGHHRAEFAEVILRGAEVGGQLVMSGAKITGKLDMGAINIRDSLFMNVGEPVEDQAGRRERAELSEVILNGANIKDQLSLSGAKITGPLNMNSVSIGGHLFMHGGAEFAEVDLSAAQVEGQLSLSGAEVTGTLLLDSASIGRDLLMAKGAKFTDVDLRNARIAGQLALVGTKVDGTLSMDGAKIGRDLFMRFGQFSKEAHLIFTVIGGSLDLRGATLGGLDLTGALVGELHLASVPLLPTWNDDAKLVLRNTQIGALQDQPGAWPKVLALDGFTYERLGGFGSEEAADARGSEWFADWLEKSKPYSTQPYHQLAKVFREIGNPDMANDILYAGREREREEYWERSKLRWLGMSLLKCTTGYGYGPRYFRSLRWVALFVVVGVVVLHKTGGAHKVAGRIYRTRHSFRAQSEYFGRLAFYSLDMLLPVIRLHEPHYREVVLEGCARYYFVLHQLMGYVLASFLIAGLAGLTR